MAYPPTTGSAPHIIPDLSYGSPDPPSNPACFPSGVSGVYVYPQSGIPLLNATQEPNSFDEYIFQGWSVIGNIDVPRPNSTWTVNGTTLVSHRVVETVDNSTDDHYLPKVSSWSGLGLITVQSSASTTYKAYATGSGIWALLGTIAGAYGGM